MNKIQVLGKQEFMGIEIPVIEGGFGEGQKVMLAKTIAEIHEVELREVNQLINNNLDEFDFGIDILDLKGIISNDTYLKEKLLQCGYTKQGLGSILGKDGNIYLLSEQGYHALVTLMRTERAKEIRKQLRRDYFQMREVVNSLDQQKAMALLKATEGKTTEEKLAGITTYTEIRIQEEKAPLITVIDTAINDEGLFDIGVIGKLLKPYCKEMGEKKIFRFLKDNGILKDKPQSQKHNTPYDRYNKYFEMKTVPIYKFGYADTYIKTYFNGVGLKWFLKKLVKEGYIEKLDIDDIKNSYKEEKIIS